VRFQTPEEKAKHAQRIEAARAIMDLEEHPGWAHFTALAEELIATYTPNISEFTEAEATKYASQLTFISGIKRCLNLMQQQKELVKKG